MVDVDRRITNSAHLAGLRRLSARASLHPNPPLNALSSHAPLALKLLALLQHSGVALKPGLSDTEFACAEALFAFSFPPDLRALLSAGVPFGPGFLDWRSTHALPAAFHLPIAAASVHISRDGIWSQSWGAKPSNPEKAMRAARIGLKRAPVMIPIFRNCYIPCKPGLAGNPVFFLDEERIFCCGSDLCNFFESLFGGGASGSSFDLSRCSLTPRWVEFWTDASGDRWKRKSPERVLVEGASEIPKWVGDYVGEISCVLRRGGWSESDVLEIVEVSASGEFDEMGAVDHEVIFDFLLLKADRLSDWLRVAGWSSEEVWDALGFNFEPKRETRLAKISPEISRKLGELGESVSLS